MILNQNQQSDAQLIGDIQNNKVGIDTNNLDFITSLLTTNLYSQPIQSFIRETVANGWDSHVEAGTTNKPVIFRIYTDDKNNVHLAVRDYGTGLSPERFNEIYLNIGSSTKRASNQYIGCFGLGRWTMLAVANICYLTNYYNGTCSKYVVYKDNVKICIDRIHESTTTEENGLEVDVNTENNPSNYEFRKNLVDGIKKLTFYNNIYIDDAERITSTIGFDCDRFNARQITDFKTFKTCNRYVKNSLLMGNVLYPINSDIIQKWFKGIDEIPFAIKCNIGDVDVTPNREQLLYNQKTIDAINKCCQAALEEIKKICQSEFGSDFKNIYDWWCFVRSRTITIPIQIYQDNSITLEIPSNTFSYYGLSDVITINGQKPTEQLFDMYNKFVQMELPRKVILYHVEDGRFHVKGNSLSISKYCNCFITDCVAFVNEPLKPIAKQYFNHQCTHSNFYLLYKPHVREAFIKLVRSFCAAYKTTPTNKTIKFIFKDFVDNYTITKTYSIENVPQDFIDATKAASKNVKSIAQQKARKCVIYQLIHGRGYDTITYDTSLSFDNIKNYKGTVFFAEKGSPYLEQFFKIVSKFLICNNRIKLVEVAASNIPLLRELDNAVEFNSVFTKKNNVISKICTCVYLCEKWNIKRNNIGYVDYIKTTSFKELTNILSTLTRCYSNLLEYNTSDYEELLKILCKTYLKNNWLKYDIISTIETNKEYIKLNNLFSTAYEHVYKSITLAFTDYVTKNGISNKENFNTIKEILKPILDEYTPNQQLPHFDT